MLIKKRAGWELPESAATPQAIFEDRRRLIKGLAAGPILLGGAGALLAACDDPGPAVAADAGGDPTKGLYPVKRNLSFRGGRPLTDEKWATSYNNFYEFGSHKQIASRAQALPIRPWTITLDGMVEKKQVIDIDTLIRKMPLEERVYRHRCVEAWSMVVPWSGFPLKALLDLAKPLGSAKYVRMQTFLNPKVARGQTQSWYPWPYTEGLTIAEASNDLAFMVTGLYGKPVPRQSGAPLRLAAPWKYGFKSIKSITHLTFTDKRPTTFWQESGPSEYGFWANVNPKVPHRRWSQATERVLGAGHRVPTQLYNGYAEQVASLYKDMKGEKLFM
ncbi:MAG: protein-methionine-sulfoxide reductase catalytic subunit MsrP [Alphaproteobacteria bacterium]